VVRVQPNPSLHPKCYGGLRPPPHSGELKRWAEYQYQAGMRRLIRFATIDRLERCTAKPQR
jgi:hypothetical protein